MPSWIDMSRIYLKLLELYGSTVAQRIEHATSGQETMDSIPALSARFLLVG